MNLDSSVKFGAALVKSYLVNWAPISITTAGLFPSILIACCRLSEVVVDIEDRDRRVDPAPTPVDEREYVRVDSVPDWAIEDTLCNSVIDTFLDHIQKNTKMKTI